MERRLETQRLALLRLLAGLGFALLFVSRAPEISMVPRWVRSYVASVLVRAESAAESLVFVSACLLFGSQAAGLSIGHPAGSLPSDALPEGGHSAQSLLRRIAALRAVLNDLPRYARRLVKRCAAKPVSPSIDYEALDTQHNAPKREPVRARIERPPDIDRDLMKSFCLPPVWGGRVLAWRFSAKPAS